MALLFMQFKNHRGRPCIFKFI